MTDKKPSDVFLALWQWRALDMTPAEFAEAAGAWRQIVSLEEIYAAAKQKEAMKDFWENWGTQPVTPLVPADTWPGPITCEARSKVDTNGQEVTEADTGEDPSPAAQDDNKAAQDDSPRAVTYDCASAPMTDEAEAAWAAAEAEAKAREAANRSAGAKAGVAKRKRNLTEKLEDLRRRGVKMHEIAAAVNGLTITDVMDALEAKAMSPMKIQALEKACRKLEEAGQ